MQAPLSEINVMFYDAWLYWNKTFYTSVATSCAPNIIARKRGSAPTSDAAAVYATLHSLERQINTALQSECKKH